MANYNLLKEEINTKVYENSRQEITGENLNSVLNAMVSTLGAEYQFAGVATKDAEPEIPDAKVFYIANGKGTYTNFGNIEVTEDDVVILYYDNTWHKVATGIASNEKLTELGINTNTQIVYVGNEQSSLVVGDVWFYNQDKILYKKKSTYNIEMPSNILCSYNGSRYLYIKRLPLIDLNTSELKTLVQEISVQTNSELVYVGNEQSSLVVGDVWFYDQNKILYKKVSSTSNEELTSGTIVKYNGSRYLYIKGKDLVNLDYTTQVNPSPGIELSNGKNKYNWRTCVDGFLQQNNVVNTGFVDYATSEIISIKKNTDYTISHTQSYEIYDGNMNSIAYRVSDGADNNYTFNSGNAVFIRVSTNFGYYQRTQIEEGTEVTSFEEYVVPRIIGGNCLSSHVSLFAGKKYLSLGDSLTERGQYQAELSYNVGGFAEINNKGVYGRVIKDWIYERNGTDLIPADTLNQYDLITFGGIANDYNNSTPIGTINDATTENTFYGSAKKVCEYLLTCCPDKMIVGFSVPQFNYTRGWGAVNEVSATMWDYNDAMRKVCERYAIPFVDIMNNSGICELNKSLYYTSSDEVHPNQRGMKRMADIIASVIIPMQNRLDKIFI